MRRRALFGSEIKTIDINNYLTFEALEDGFTFSYENTVQYCIDGIDKWEVLRYDTDSPPIKAGHTISIKANLVPSSSSGLDVITLHKKCNLLGNCMSLLYGDGASEVTTLDNVHTFYRLFYKAENIVSVSKTFLPATTLSNNCYYEMFRGCTSLVTAPELPATTLARSCYLGMFQGCSSLVAAPQLPATTLTEYCYYQMFSGCTSLVTAPELPATTLADSCYGSMFSGCTSLVNAPELPATTLADGCYAGMFANTNLLPDCTNINFENPIGLRGLFKGTKVTDDDLYKILPINPNTGRYFLPATILAERSYGEMFRGCTSLVTAPELPATTLAYVCYYEMFYGCTSLVTAPELPATTLADSCYDQMFLNCTSLVAAPELPATTLARSCYGSMFSGCKNINFIKMLATDISASYCLSSWVYGVSPTGTFVKSKDATWDVVGTSGVPEGWTVEYE